MGNAEKKSDDPSNSFWVRVTRVLDHGIQVERIDDKRAGYIKRREISWERSISKPIKMPEVGEIVKAVNLNVTLEQPGGDSATSMSLRRVRDPWAEAIAKHRYKIHDIVEGEVVNVLYDRAYVQLEPGIDAVIYPKDIPMLREKSIDEILKLGDRLSGQIISSNPGEHHIEINIIKRLQCMDSSIDGQRKLFEGYFGAQQHPRSIDSTELSISPVQLLQQTIHLRQGLGRLVRFLIVDDEEDWMQYLRSGLVGEFKTEIDTAMTGEETLEKVQKGKEYSLILIDLHLYHESGIDVARCIVQARPGIPILITSAAPFQDMEEYSEFPYCPKNIEDLIDKINLMRMGVILENPKIKLLPQPSLAQQLGLQVTSQRELPEVLGEILAILRQKTSITHCMLLELVDKRTISIIAADPAIPADWPKIQRDLYLSPVRQVLESGQELCENQIEFELDRKFVNFFPQLTPRSCLALPVRSPDSKTSYGLFLLDHQAGIFNIHKDSMAQQRFENTHIAAQQIAILLERTRLMEHIRRYEERYVLGQLLGNMMHETNNKLNGLLTHIKTYKEHLSQHPEWQKSHLLPEWFNNLSQDAKKFQSDYDDLKTLADAYARQAISDYESVDINQMVEKVAHQLLGAPVRQGTRTRQNTQIWLDAKTSLPPALGISTHIQQIIMNLMLNALQMIDQQRNLMKLIESQAGLTTPLRQTGQVIVQTRYNQSAARPIEIRIIDSGPGIHWLDQERIFEQGFSRRGGSGLGLSICRDLVERMGGRLILFDSILFMGSVFIIELPCYPNNGENL
jgi:signal transduction histidine kinase